MITKLNFAAMIVLLIVTSAPGKEPVGLVGSWSFDVCQMISHDKGRTWTKPVRRLRGEAPSLLLTIDNVLLCGHRERPGVRTGVILSTDFGETWSPPRMIDFAGGAYPSFVELDDGRVLCIHYQEGAGGNIRQAVFKVNRRSRTIELIDP